MTNPVKAEKNLEAWLREQCSQLGWMMPKWVSPGMAGVPDRIIIGPRSGPVPVELKKPGGRLSPQQRRVHQELARLGWPVYVIWNRTQAEQLIRLLGGEKPTIKIDCPTCEGTGYVDPLENDLCPDCHGGGVIKRRNKR